VLLLLLFLITIIIIIGGFENSVAQISAYTHDSNEIPTATPMFPGLGNTYRLKLGIRVPAWA